MVMASARTTGLASAGTRGAIGAVAVIALLLGACSSSPSGDVASPAGTPVAGATAGSATAAGDCGGPGLGMAPAPDGPLADQEVGDPLPVMRLARLDDCTPVSTDDWIGQPLVLNFWASWCGPCEAEMPELAAAAERLGDRVRFVGITFEDAPADSRAFLERIPVPYDNFVDANGHELFRAIRGRGTPSTVLVDESGAVVFRHAGAITSDQLAAAIEEHLDIDTAA